jgi:competence ComEA-like helix-hairpin-helix protein
MMKNNLPFIITMSLFAIACVAVTVFTIRNEPQYVQIVASQTTAAADGHAADGSPFDDTEKLNINTATLEELQTLSGIGEVIAARIIAYREEHGGFLYIEEIMEVSGIGETMFEDLRELIAVD